MQDPDHFSMPLATLYEFYAYFSAWGMHGEGRRVPIFNNFFLLRDQKATPRDLVLRKINSVQKSPCVNYVSRAQILLRDQKATPLDLVL